MTRQTKKRIALSIGLLGIVLLLFPRHFAHADNIGILDLMSTPFSTLLEYLAQTALQVVGNLIAITAKSLNYAIDLRAGGSIPVVAASWKILRDFSNMFFVVILIYMAFATIFDQSNYSFQKMIARFVIAAVLINFSLVLGNMVIDACQVLSNVFIGSIGNLGDRLGTYLNPISLLPGAGNVTLASAAGGNLVSLIFALILALIFLFSMIVAFTFAIIRVPIIWGLLIVSPIAWMAGILPATRSSRFGWSGWWSQFFGWNLFLPVYLFYMYLGLLFLSKRNEVISAVLQFNGANNPANLPLSATLTGGMTFNLLFFYIFAGVIMIGGTWAATKTTSLMGSGFEKGVHLANEFGHNIWGYTQVRPALQALQDRRKQLAEEGLPGPLGKLWRGRAGYESDRNWYAERLGVKSAQFKNQKDEVSDVNKEMGRLKDQERAGRLTITSNFADGYDITTTEGAARKAILHERGMTSGADFDRDISALVTKNPFLAQELSSKAKSAKYKDVKADQLLRMAAAKGEYSKYAVPQATAMRKEWFDFAVDERDGYNAMTADDYGTAITLMGGKTTKEGDEFRKKVMKKRPDLVMEYETKDIKGDVDESRAEKIQAEWEKEFGKPGFTPSDIGKLPKKAWENPTFQLALGNHILKLRDDDPFKGMGKKERVDAGGPAKYVGPALQYKAKIRTAIGNNSSESLAKLKVLKEGVAPEISALATPEYDFSGAAGGQPPPGVPPPAA